MKEKCFNMKWLKYAVGFVFALVLMCVVPDYAEAATVKLGDVTYTSKISGNKTTIYGQKKGSSKKAIKTVNGAAYPVYAYKNTLYFERDNTNDPMLIDIWALNLSTKAVTKICKNATFVDAYKQYLVVTPNTGAFMPMPYSVYNVSAKKQKCFSKKCIGANISGGKIYFVEGSQNKDFTCKVKVYRCSLSGNSKQTVSKDFLTAGGVYRVNAKYVQYYKNGKWYQYTYATRKTKKIACPY